MIEDTAVISDDVLPFGVVYEAATLSVPHVTVTVNTRPYCPPSTWIKLDPVWNALVPGSIRVTTERDATNVVLSMLMQHRSPDCKYP